MHLVGLRRSLASVVSDQTLYNVPFAGPPGPKGTRLRVRSRLKPALGTGKLEGSSSAQSGQEPLFALRAISAQSACSMPQRMSADSSYMVQTRRDTCNLEYGILSLPSVFPFPAGLSRLRTRSRVPSGPGGRTSETTGDGRRIVK
jgi:hypothetical protein